VGYEDRTITAKCGNCGRQYLMSWRGFNKRLPPKALPCKCGVKNVLGKVPEWPHLPDRLHIGYELNRLAKLHPLPPDKPSWEPYSIRSFVAQASEQLGGCLYSSSPAGSVMGKQVPRDDCLKHPDDLQLSSGPCDFIAGFTKGRETCPLVGTGALALSN
jgi:hypothetical protein